MTTGRIATVEGPVKKLGVRWKRGGGSTFFYLNGGWSAVTGGQTDRMHCVPQMHEVLSIEPG